MTKPANPILLLFSALVLFSCFINFTFWLKYKEQKQIFYKLQKAAPSLAKLNAKLEQAAASTTLKTISAQSFLSTMKKNALFKPASNLLMLSQSANHDQELKLSHPISIHLKHLNELLEALEGDPVGEQTKIYPNISSFEMTRIPNHLDTYQLNFQLTFNP